MATLSDVARRAGVSISAVSRVLSNAPTARVSAQTRERIKQAAAELNYRPNFAGRALKFSRTNVVALILPDVTNAFATEIMMGVEHEALERGYTVLLGRSEDMQPGGEMINRLVGEGRVDGILVQVGDPTLPEEIDKLIAANYPAVFLNLLRDSYGGCVAIQDQEGVAVATRHLIERGHRRLALLGGVPQSFTAGRRVEGFRQTMGEAGLEVDDRLITRYGYFPADGRAAIREVMSQSEPPTGIVVCNVNAALGALAEARALGLRVPEDLSIISVHDAWPAEVSWPSLTCVKMPMYQLGRAAMGLLYDRLHGAEVGQLTVTDPAPQLILRESTATLSGGGRGGRSSWLP